MGKFSSPGGAASDGKAGDIQTRNQKKAARRGKEHDQGRLDIPDDVIQQRPALRGLAYKWIIEVLLAKAAHDERQLRRCFCCGHSGLQPSNDYEHVRIQLCPPIRKLFVVNRRPQLHALDRICEPRGHDADDSVGLAIEMDCLVEDRGITSEAPLPQSPAQNSRRIRGWLVVRGSETSPERRFHPSIGRRFQEQKAARTLSGSCPFVLDRLYCGQLSTIAKSEKPWLCFFHSVNIPPATSLYGNLSSALCSYKRTNVRHPQRQGLHKNRAYDGKQSNIRADTDGNHKDGDEGEAWSSCQSANTYSQILQKQFESCPTPGVAGLLAQKHGVTERSRAA